MISCTHLPPSGQPVIIIMCCSGGGGGGGGGGGITMKYTNYANNSSWYSVLWGEPERAPFGAEYSEFLLHVWVDDNDDDDDV